MYHQKKKNRKSQEYNNGEFYNGSSVFMWPVNEIFFTLFHFSINIPVRVIPNLSLTVFCFYLVSIYLISQILFFKTLFSNKPPYLFGKSLILK